MPRHQVSMACQHCREKRAKCNGEDPCRRCKDAGLDCVFKHSVTVSKSDLRIQIKQLRRENRQKDALLMAHGLVNTALTHPAFSHRVLDNVSAAIELATPVSDSCSSYRPSQPSPWTRHSGYSPPSSAGSHSSDISLTPSLSSSQCQEILWCHSERQTSFGAPMQPGISRLTSPDLEASLAPSAADMAPDQISDWTRSGCTIPTVVQHLNSLSTWDCMPFCLLGKASFLHDLTSGGGKYCSSKLIYAFLALSTRTMNERYADDYGQLLNHYGSSDDFSGSKGTPWSPDWPDCQVLYNKAAAILDADDNAGGLPDVQALGLMTLYQVSRGYETEARELAGRFAAAATDLCLREQLRPDEEEQYQRVRETTYCGAVSLVRYKFRGYCVRFSVVDLLLTRIFFRRVLELTQYQLGRRHDAELQDDGIILEDSLCIFRQLHGTMSTRSTFVLDASTSHPGNVQLIPVCIFQLTEWVCKFLAAPGSASGDQVVTVYRQCLDWHESSLTPLIVNESNLPVVLFIHIYYHFCLLSMFRSLATVKLEGIELNSREISQQAAQAILTLTQSYADAIGLRRVSSLLPYFVCSSGLLSLAAKETGTDVLDVQSCRGDATLPFSVQAADSPTVAVKEELNGDATTTVGVCHDIDRHGQQLLSASHVDLPAVAHARLLLTEMGAVHPLATMLEAELHRASIKSLRT